MCVSVNAAQPSRSSIPYAKLLSLSSPLSLSPSLPVCLSLFPFLSLTVSVSDHVKAQTRVSRESSGKALMPHVAID